MLGSNLKSGEKLRVGSSVEMPISVNGSCGQPISQLRREAMSMKFAFSTFAFGLLTLSLMSCRALAATPTASFSVSATVQATCLVSATSMTFGTYTGTVINAQSDVSVTCTNATPFNVGLNPGLAASATATTRKLTGPGAALLGYSLLKLTGDRQLGSDRGRRYGCRDWQRVAEALAVYGQIPAGQYVAPRCLYADTITVTR